MIMPATTNTMIAICVQTQIGDTRASARADDQHRARGVVRHLVRDRAEQEALGARHALVADDDEVGADLLGDIEDRVGGVALARLS